MKKVLLSLLFIAAFNFTVYVEAADPKVWICTGSGAYAYHNNRGCSGLNNCKATIKQVTLKEAREGWQPTPIEFLFENKCEMELEYCKLASLKVAGQLTKEVMESSMIILEKCKGILNENRSEYRCD